MRKTRENVKNNSHQRPNISALMGTIHIYNKNMQWLRPLILLFAGHCGAGRCHAIGLIELEVSACVVVRDVLDHASESLAVVGELSCLDVVAKQIAEQTAEILVARVAQE